MAGFKSNSTALSVFQVDTPSVVTPETLKKFAFRPIDTLKGEELAVGWTNIDDILDTAWANSVPEKGEWLCFALRVDKRKIPGAILKKHFGEALKKEQEALATQGKHFVSRERKKELKEQLKLRLLANTEPAPASVDVVMNKESGQLLVASTAKGMLAHLTELMPRSFGVQIVPLEPQTDVQQVLRTIYDAHIQGTFENHTYKLTDAGRVTLAGISEADASGIEVVVKNDRTSADAGLAGGLSIAKLTICMERENDSLVWGFGLNGLLEFSGLKVPAAKKNKEDAQDTVLLEKLYLIEQAVGVIHNLFGNR